MNKLNTERFEIKFRTKVKELINRGRTNPLLAVTSGDIQKGFFIFRESNIDILTNDIYQLLLSELDDNIK